MLVQLLNKLLEAELPGKIRVIPTSPDQKKGREIWGTRVRGTGKAETLQFSDAL